MNKISVNWELAPKGTTHYMPENDDFYASWIKKVGSFYFEIWYNGQWTTDSALDIYQDTFIIKPAEDREVIWNGNGLPPVGTVCEWFSEDYGWLGGRVVGHAGPVSVISHNDGYTGCHLHQVRPFRTPEQIAEEAAVKVLADLLKSWGLDPIDSRQIAQALHSAGYRKENK